MRKNKKDRKNLSVGTDNSANKIAPKTKKTPLISKALDKVRGVRVVYSIKGLNLDAFINLLKNRNIDLYDIKKVGNKHLIVTVSLFDSKKLFAFAKEMCYNIEKVKEKGAGYPLLLSLRSIGLVLGCLIFIISTTLLSDIVYEISFSGTGSVCQREVLEYLDGVGIKTGAKFSQIDYQNLEDQILAKINSLSFVSIEKRGNTLSVDLALAKEQTDRLNSQIYSLYSPTDGVMEDIKVYRGTSLVSVGDGVQKGTLLVDGYMTIKDNRVDINVLASITIITEQKFIYTDKSDNAEDKAILFAEAQFSDSEIVSLSVQKYQNEQGFTYQVIVKQRVIVNAG